MSTASFPDRETVANKMASFDDADRSYLALIMENAAQDESLIEGLLFWLNKQASAPFLNTLKLGQVGEWLGNAAPARLQIRLMETARSSQHAAFEAFREGLKKSGGLERAFPQV